MVDTEITKGQLKQLFEIEGSLTRFGMRGLKQQFQALLDANKGRASSHRVKPAHSIWQAHRLPGYADFEAYLESIPADQLILSSIMEQVCSQRVLVDPRYTVSQLARTVEPGVGSNLRDFPDEITRRQPYWIACGFVSEESAVGYCRAGSRDGSSTIVRPMTVLEGLAWYLQHPPSPTLPVFPRRIRLASTVGVSPEGHHHIPELVISYPKTRLVLEYESGAPVSCGICVVRKDCLS